MTKNLKAIALTKDIATAVRLGKPLPVFKLFEVVVGRKPQRAEKAALRAVAADPE